MLIFITSPRSLLSQIEVSWCQAWAEPKSRSEKCWLNLRIAFKYLFSHLIIILQFVHKDCDDYEEECQEDEEEAQDDITHASIHPSPG